MIKSIFILIILIAITAAIQWPVGFASGYTIKNRVTCQLVKNRTIPFRYTAGGIMRGEKAAGTLRTEWYVDGLKKGMLFSLKGCYDAGAQS